MNKESINKYTMKITQANKGQLLVIVYDIILEDLEHAKSLSLEDSLEEYINDVKHAQRFLLELMDTLEHKYEISGELMRLYIYVNRELIYAMMRKDVKHLDNAIMVIEKIRKSFEEIAKTDDSAPLMRNVQQVYAGLTYGRSSLNEMSIDNVNRGFKA